MVEVTAKAPKVEKEATVNYNFGENLGEMVDLFGEDVVRNYAERQMTIQLQANIRRLLEAGQTPEQIQEAINRWKPGVITRLVTGGGDPLTAALSAFDGMSPDEQQAFIQKFMDKAKEGV